MIPQTDVINLDLPFDSQPSKQHQMLENGRIIGTVDNSVKQTVFKILLTERYQYPVYSWNYGVEMLDLIGKDLDYVKKEIERRITEALTQDDRINAVDSFEFENADRHSLQVFFTVHSVFGSEKYKKVVNV